VALWAVAGLYVAGVVGAGFASGQELVVFFVRYGQAGLAGVIWSSLLLCAGTGLILEACARHGVGSYNGLLRAVDPKWSALWDSLYGIFLLVGTAVMFAGMAAASESILCREALRFGSAALVLFLLGRGARALLRVSAWIAPLLVLSLTALTLGHLGKGVTLFTARQVGAPALGSALEAGTLYACYNLGFAMTFLATSHHYLKTRKERWLLALLGPGILGGSMLLLCLALGTLEPAQLAQPYPLAGLLPGWRPWARGLYTVFLWSAMLTTAAANTLALTSRFAQLPKMQWGTAVLTAVLLSLALSHLGFSQLVSVAYPILGLVGLWLLAHLLWDALR